MLKKAAMLMFAMSLMLTAFSHAENVQASGDAPDTRATWLWNPWMFVKDEAAVLAFLENKNVNKVYVQIDRDIPKDTYRSFVTQAHARGIAVFALDGAPSWVAPKGYTNQNMLMNWLSNYQSGSTEQASFDGIHLDVEPYLYSGWNSNRATTVKSYQSLLQRAVVSSSQLNLPLEADMPFWFDEIPYNNTFGSGLLAEWVIANTDGVTLMAYRDSAPMIIEIVKNEIAMAEKYGKHVVVGVETGTTDEGSIITFAEEGEAFMNLQLGEVAAHYSGYSAYEGIAIHHVGSWMTLKP
ncbi:amidase [Planococcus sp. A6]|uniref:amidase n=1 Tax=Planococcus sp. A6 TaxID=2992760 RepID=UPI00237C1215|nr:amidase [Planococcus sp. A6]MDE0582277.1 amidase [Planococcus sp. A6]